MMCSALAVHILKSIKILRKAYLSSYLILAALFASYFSSFLVSAVRLSSYNLLFPFIAPLLVCAPAPGPNPDDADWIEDLGGTGPRVAAYSRVSSSKQVKGQSLDVQKEAFDKMKEMHKPIIIYGFTDPGKSGEDFDKRKINSIMKLAEEGLIDELWITWINRLGRNCRKLLLFCLNLFEEGVTIRTPEKQFDLKDLSSLLVLTIEANEAEQENKRRAKTAIASKARLFRLKKWNKPVPLGFLKENNWLVKICNWDPIIREIFAKFFATSSLEYVRKYINTKYREFLPKGGLTRSQLRRLLSDPVYIGMPGHLGVIVEDYSLAFISSETFRAAQEILARIGSNHKPKGEDPVRKLVELYGISALDFLKQIEYIHKSCQGPIRKNGTRIYGGISRRLFECKKCQKQWIIPTDNELKEIQVRFAGQERMYKKALDNKAKNDVLNPLFASTQNITTKLKEEKRSRIKPKANNKDADEYSQKKSFRQTRLDDN
jgi:DNA invertase Pin-like site-specific DNA recombinase